MQTLICKNCSKSFSSSPIIDGKQRNCYNRKLCFECSPFGGHNTRSTGKYATKYIKSKESMQKGMRRYHKKMRLLALLKLGAKCNICGYDNLRVLEFDHINNDGAKDRREKPTSAKFRMFRDIIAGIRTDIQVLCANCHRIKTWDSFSVKDEILGYII